MSVDINLVVFGGRLTSDPSPIGDGTKGCRFDLASNRRYKTRDGVKQEETTYMSIVCWGPQGEAVMKYCSKGTPVIVEGRLENRRIETEAGVKRFVNIVANDVRFVSTVRSEAPSDPSETIANTDPRLPSGVSQEAQDKILSLVKGL